MRGYLATLLIAAALHLGLTANADPVPVASDFVHQVISIGDTNYAIVGPNHELWEWGIVSADSTQAISQSIPKPVPELRGIYIHSLANNVYSEACAIAGQNRELYCWHKVLDPQRRAQRWLPITFGHDVGVRPSRFEWMKGHAVRSMSMSSIHICLNLMDDSLWCWGQNESDQIGSDTKGVPQQFPVRINRMSALKVKSVAVSRNTTCVLVGEQKNSICWGEPLVIGKFITGFKQSRKNALEPYYPFRNGVEDESFDFVTSNGSDVICFVQKAKNKIFCNMPYGELKTGSSSIISDLVLKRDKWCVQTEGQSRKTCSGYSQAVSGLLLAGSLDRYHRYKGIFDDTDFLDFEAFSSGNEHHCAVKFGKLKCFGFNLYGQLGIGNSNEYGDDPHETYDQLPFVEFKEVKATEVETEAD